MKKKIAGRVIKETKYINARSDFKNRHFREVIIACMQWYLKYLISYHHLQDVMLERGVEVN